MPAKTPKELWSDTLSSVQFLSRWPVHHLPDCPTELDFAKTAYSFPLAGLLIAIAPALLLLALAHTALPSFAIATITIAVLIISTGALHEDGLSDVADGFWGGFDRDRKLAIMRDSTIGTYGSLSLIISLLLRCTLLAHFLDETGPIAAALALLAISSLSRASMLVPWIYLPNARPEKPSKTQKGKADSGLSARYGMPDETIRLPLALCTLPALVLLILASSLIGAMAALALASCSIYCLCQLARRHIGGHTGDVLGATQQMSELGLLLGLAMIM